MKKIVLVLALAFTLAFLAACTQQPPTVTIPTITFENGIEISIEIADDEPERASGLMFRQNLGERDGMLFVFEQEQPVSFWMKNTLIPLDMIFVDENFTITEIKKDVQPCKEEPCPSYPSKENAKYVVEVNSGFSEKNNIQTGERIFISVSVG